jgi:hypothetical protein
MKLLKGLLVWPLLMVMRLFHLGERKITPEEQRQALAAELNAYLATVEDAGELLSRKDFWKHQK